MTTGAFRICAAACTMLITLLFATSSFAAARVQWSDLKPKERDNESWKLSCKIFLDKPPDVAHVAMKFEFTPKVYYERSLVDGQEEPQLRKVPLKNKQAIIETVTVGFMDPGRGTIQKGTMFTFKITRAHGFEAGEYDLVVRDSRNGRTIGRKSKLVLQGENKVIDRRTISFVGDGKKKKKDDQMKKVDKDGNIKEDGDAPGDADPDQDNMDVAAVHKEGWDPVYGAPATEEGDPEEESGNNPGEIKEKPGGCGCQLPGGSSPSGALLFGLPLLGLFLGRRHLRI